MDREAIEAHLTIVLTAVAKIPNYAVRTTSIVLTISSDFRRFSLLSRKVAVGISQDLSSIGQELPDALQTTLAASESCRDGVVTTGD